MTKIITTIGPASDNEEMLSFFVKNKVEIARLNFSHNTPQWHIETGKKARNKGLKLMLDLAGPKVLLGNLKLESELETGKEVIIEKENPERDYPDWERSKEDKQTMVLPTYLDFYDYVNIDSIILIDDGKVQLKVKEKKDNRLLCDVIFGGKVKSHKGINLPKTKLNIDFLVDRDKDFLKIVLPELKPEFVAPSFVKTVDDLNLLKVFIEKILKDNNINDYFPKICTKLEMSEAVENDINLINIIDNSDMLMIARGDLALETNPLHIKVPFLQDKIIDFCRKKDKPFVVATQILESMFISPVPLRSEISDLYRATKINKANYIMLSGETAAGKFPKKCVELMSQMIDLAEEK